MKPHLFNLEVVLCFVFSFKLNFICCQALYLQNNRIKQLPSNIGNLKNLQTLNISGNNLKDLPPSISGLTCLKTLDLSKNPKLTKLPKDIGHLHSLGRINIESSFIRRHLTKSIIPKMFFSHQKTCCWTQMLSRTRRKTLPLRGRRLL